jgi:thymidylate synthase (FAD)
MTTFVDKSIPVLDKGFIRVIDIMGNDSAIVQAARVSYGDGTKTPSDDKKLIRYLYKNKHTSPFEMCEIKLHIKAPLFVARQWLRHRTANVNEISARYSIMKEEFYIPELSRVQGQSATNKQGSGQELDIETQKWFVERVKKNSQNAFQDYNDALEKEVSRELARMMLPVNLYTEWYWKIDLHNLLHFVRLRDESHAQYEIQVYAQAIREIIKEWCPMTYEAFSQYK